MYFRQPLLLICILLILTERVHSQSAKGPGISSCSYSNFRESACNWLAFQVSEIPAECTSLNYLIAIIDENYCIGPSTSGSDYASKDFKEFGSDVCLKNLIDEINYLEKEGIQIKTKSRNFQIYFGLGLVLGDNLGVNTILEFSKSFSANYFCRFCKAHKSITQSMTTEDNTLMRTNENYSLDVLQSDFRQTETIQLFTLKELNNRKSTFNYESLEIGNCSPPILNVHLKKC
ncbi:hypothetical protein AGLY_008469 [Aphis glycines]|uniref:Uncharacterized protein n=1 Tax=Aphis glycines TaxID=307491 RepID=A0A6G0TMC2_APHGL|nr:hypothetical protein AGLY_008469 [Aphis glycines]